MDGTRDQPPGKNAENWSRRDGIRAGAVSGPWRSAPRAGSPVADPQPATTPAPPPGTGPARTSQPAAKPAPVPLRPTGADAAPGRRHAVPARRRKQVMVAGIAGGVIGALGIVAFAFFLRPAEPPAPAGEIAAPAPPSPLPATPTEPAAFPPSEQAASDAPPDRATTAPLADPALATVTSVRLRVGPDFAADRQQAIVAALQAAGIGSVQVEALPFAITASRVGYYRPEDLPAAEALGRILGPVASPDGTAIGVRDYAQLLAGATPGRLDLWIGG